MHWLGRERAEHGASMVVIAIMLPLLIGFAAFVIDVGLMYHARAQLQTAADAAALAAVLNVDDPAAATVAAQDYGTANYSGSGTIVAPSDVQLGTWDSGSDTFTAGGADPDAVRVVTLRAEANGNPLPLFFGGVLGREQTDVQASAVAALESLGTAGIVPVSLRSPGFGPVDPQIYADNPAKPGPSTPANGSFFVPGEEVVVFIFGKGPQSPVHLVLDIPVPSISDVLRGIDPPYPISVGEFFVAGEGTGQGGFGGDLAKRLDFPVNHPMRTIIVPVVEETATSRNAEGEVAGPVRIADFAAVHLDAVIEQGEGEFLVGTVVELTVSGSGAGGENPSGAGGGTVRGISLVQ